MDLLHLVDCCSTIGPVAMDLESPRPIEAPRPPEPPPPAISVKCTNLSPLSYGYNVGRLRFEVNPAPDRPLSMHVFVDGNDTETCWIGKTDGLTFGREEGAPAFVLDDEVLDHKVDVQLADRVLGWHVGPRIAIPAMAIIPVFEADGKLVMRGKSVHVDTRYTCKIKKVPLRPGPEDFICSVFRQGSDDKRHIVPMDRLPFGSTYIMDPRVIPFESTVPVSIYLLWRRKIREGVWEDIQISPCDTVSATMPRGDGEKVVSKDDVVTSPAPIESSSSREDEVMGSSLDDAEAAIEPIQTNAISDRREDPLPPNKRKREAKDEDSGTSEKAKEPAAKKPNNGVYIVTISPHADEDAAKTRRTGIKKLRPKIKIFKDEIFCQRDEAGKKEWFLRVWVDRGGAEHIKAHYTVQICNKTIASDTLIHVSP